MLAISADIVTKWLLVELIFLINAVTFRKLIFVLIWFHSYKAFEYNS